MCTLFVQPRVYIAFAAVFLYSSNFRRPKGDLPGHRPKLQPAKKKVVLKVMTGCAGFPGVWGPLFRFSAMVLEQLDLGGGSWTFLGNMEHIHCWTFLQKVVTSKEVGCMTNKSGSISRPSTAYRQSC